jgi:hypothetical protein
MLTSSNYNPLGLVCVKTDGQPFDPERVSKNFKNAIKGLGFLGSFKSLRHYVEC